ncbi:Protein of unknown function [Pedobacter steynii]|uniref:SMODS and SLOG-associating 2TM effector domain-containing protein n=1 Tax=Pedobacter steynii TaxID=430522 RepID=A0A1H0KM97_9SPHI|nr:DUF4231 domain-containing protein [Pedobacter steynii]NQX43330.1 DUF4231 domain-containing protein [Pedobacter steynii]SDO57048.1 Protein of unknown function [Pedobacter steynii]
MENEQLTFLKGSIQKRIEGIDGRRVYYRRSAFNTYITVAILSTLVTIVLGLNLQDYKEEIRIIALLISSLVTIVNYYNTFFNFKTLWVANNEALNRFYALRFAIDFFEKGADQDVLKIKAFSEEYQRILDGLNQEWKKSRLDSV